MKYVIFGGTGTLGHATVERLYGDDITIISRCELRQKKMREKFPSIKFILGDVTYPDYAAWPRHADVVMNFAAQKHVDVAELNQGFCNRINYNGAVNTSEYAERVKAYHHVFTSTDKAVLPINAYGKSKGLAESYLLSRNDLSNVHHSVFRWGNILGSRGSVLEYFARTLMKEKTVYITDTRMTRFWALIEDVAKFMLDNYESASANEAEVPPMKASTVLRLVEALARHLEIKDYRIIATSIRPGEKIHECLISTHDSCLRSDNAEQYTDDELDYLVGRTLR